MGEVQELLKEMYVPINGLDELRSIVHECEGMTDYERNQRGAYRALLAIARELLNGMWER